MPSSNDEHIEPGAPPPPPPRKSLFEVGEGVYANCTVCHQPNGLGIPGAFPPLAGSEWALGNPERVAVIVMNGLMGPIDVKGATFNSAMPGLGAALSDEQIAAVATFVRGNSEWGNQRFRSARGDGGGLARPIRRKAYDVDSGGVGAGFCGVRVWFIRARALLQPRSG